jgi:hypothetical protein
VNDHLTVLQMIRLIRVVHFSDEAWSSSEFINPTYSVDVQTSLQTLQITQFPLPPNSRKGILESARSGHLPPGCPPRQDKQQIALAEALLCHCSLILWWLRLSSTFAFAGPRKQPVHDIMVMLVGARVLAVLSPNLPRKAGSGTPRPCEPERGLL